MTRIRWSPTAANDLEGICDYLLENLPSYASSTMQKLFEAAESLLTFPNRGRIGKMKGTRELFVPPLPYVILYRVDADIVHILRVFHSAPDRSGALVN